MFAAPTAGTTGHVHSIESFATNDGPGVRCVVFMQGCALRCRYCHNPDTWAAGVGESMTAEQLVRRVLRFRPYWGKEGGVTISGGEPTFQADFVGAVFELLRGESVHTTLDTSGYFLDEHAKYALRHTNLVILDVKHTDCAKHEWLTEKENERPRQFLEYITEHRIPMWVRQVILPGFNDNEHDVRELAELLKNRPNLQRVELLPFHNMGKAKWEAMGLPYTLADVEPPSPETMSRLGHILREAGLPVCS